jgi:hypothetical protein
LAGRILKLETAKNKTPQRPAAQKRGPETDRRDAAGPAVDGPTGGPQPAPHPQEPDALTVQANERPPVPRPWVFDSGGDDPAQGWQPGSWRLRVRVGEEYLCLYELLGEGDKWYAYVALESAPKSFLHCADSISTKPWCWHPRPRPMTTEAKALIVEANPEPPEGCTHGQSWDCGRWVLRVRLSEGHFVVAVRGTVQWWAVYDGQKREQSVFNYPCKPIAMRPDHGGYLAGFGDYGGFDGIGPEVDAAYDLLYAAGSLMGLW